MMKYKERIFVFFALCLGLLFSLYKINVLMPFFSDIGWFYMSAKNMLQTGTIPLVGIPSSHPWLHQGAYWTYLLAGGLFFSPNPLQGAYITIGNFILTILLMYIIGKKFFSARVGVIASIFYAASPLIIMNARMPYHTSIIPLGSLLLFYTTVRWVQGNKYYFPLSIILLAVLYNLEIATAIYGGIFSLIFLLGIWKKNTWAKDVLTKKIIVLSLMAYVIPMLPMLLYDVQHNFPQTIRFLMWIGYRVLVVFGYPELHPEILPHTSMSMSTFVIQTLQKLYFAPSWLVAVGIAALSLSFINYLLFRQWQKKKILQPHVVLFLYTILPFIAILTMGTVSEAYFPMIFPFFILCTAVYIAYLFTRKYGKVYVPLLIGIYLVGNGYALLKHDYYQPEGLRYSDKIQAARQIVTEAEGKEYNLIGVGKNSEFPSYTMPYQYLTWVLGNAPVKQKVKRTFIIEEQTKGITILQKND